MATVLGVAHPPGFPFYTLLGKLFISLIPFGTPAYRLNLLSALLAALTLVFVSRAVRALTDSEAAGLIAAGALGVSTTFWSQATTANVRMLTALCAAMALHWLTKFKLQTSNPKPQISSRKFPTSDLRLPTSHVPRHTSHVPPSLILFSLSLGLGISHHASLAFMGVVFVIYLLLLDPTLLRPSRRWLMAGVAFLAPFLFTVYLPLRGAAGAFLAPPRLATLAGFLEHVLARGFEGDFFYFAHFKDLPDRLPILGNILTFQFNLVILVAASIGALAAFRRDWRLFFLLAGSFAVHSFVAITYRAPQTVEYMLPAYVVLAIALGYGIGVTLHASRFTFHISRFTLHPPRCTLHVILAFLSLAALSLFLRNLPSYLWLSRDDSTREYAEAVLTSAPENAVVLSSWHWATPLWYLQKVEGLRPDVDVEYVFPQGLSLAQKWVERIGANVGKRPTVITSFYPLEYAGTIHRFVPLGPAWLVSDSPIATLPYPLTPLNATSGGRWKLAGYHLESNEIRPGEAIRVLVAWQSLQPPEDINFFVQLLGPDGALYGQMDVNHPAARYATNELLIDRYLVTIRPDAPPGEYSLVAGAYLPDGTRLTSADGTRDKSLLSNLQVSVATSPPVTRHPVFHLLPGLGLIGYDYDRTLPDSTRLTLHWRLSSAQDRATVWADGAPFVEISLPAGPGYLTTTTDLPNDARDIQVLPGASRVPFPLDLQTYSLPDPVDSDRYVPLGGSLVLVGESYTQLGATEVQVDLDFLSARPLIEDDIVKVDLIGPNYAWRAESNSVPAGGAIPTLKWVAGSLIHDRHRLTLPRDAAPGPARLELATYDHFTARVLPILDPRLALVGSTVPLGEIEINP
ncbi:MAG: DUF2723 domain-containing protein [Chloroflexi bacterium]|nr:DUF2723 domain-containing protein [Chloroflexota bacterium]